MGKCYRELEPVLIRVYKEHNLYDKPLQQGMKDLAGKQEKNFWEDGRTNILSLF
jgi:hypothetical protein